MNLMDALYPGSLWRNNKNGQTYRVLMRAIAEDTQDTRVIYQQAENPITTWDRSLSAFLVKFEPFPPPAKLDWRIPRKPECWAMAQSLVGCWYHIFLNKDGLFSCNLSGPAVSQPLPTVASLAEAMQRCEQFEVDVMSKIPVVL